MFRRRIGVAAGTACAAILLVCAVRTGKAAESGRPPNIVLIVSDDQGYSG